MQTSKIIHPDDTILVYITQDCPMEWAEYFVGAFPNNNVVVIPSGYVDNFVILNSTTQQNKEVELPF